MTIGVSDYGAAADHLERLRVRLQAANPLIRFGNRTRSGARIGEYRFEIGPGTSVYVQAPVTPTGQRRSWYSPRTRWRYGRRGADAGWQYAATHAQVANAIVKKTRRYWDGAPENAPPPGPWIGRLLQRGRGAAGAREHRPAVPRPRNPSWDAAIRRRSSRENP